MSLVNLAHACSHLTNASMARLGVTSIPYNKLNLALSLLLHKQGFVSRITVAGKSPPKSLFPAHLRDELSPKVKRASLKQEIWEPTTNNQPLDDALSDSELDFLLEHFRKLRQEQAQSAVEQGEESTNARPEKISAQQEPVQPADSQQDSLSARQIEIIESNRRIVDEAQRMVAQRGGTDADLRELVARALQNPSPDAVNTASATADPTYTEVEDFDQEGIVTQANRASRRLWLGLKYWDGMPVMSKLAMISLPKKPINLDLDQLRLVVRGRDTATVKGMTRVGEVIALRTSKGMLDAREAIERRVGGQVLCRIY